MQPPFRQGVRVVGAADRRGRAIAASVQLPMVLLPTPDRPRRGARESLPQTRWGRGEVGGGDRHRREIDTYLATVDRAGSVDDLHCDLRCPPV